MIKTMLSVIGVLLFMSCAQPQEGITRINIEKQMEMTGKQDVVVIDIRTPEEVAQAYIKGASKFFDFYAADFKEKIEALDKEKTYIVYCRSGGRSTKALNLMLDLGFKKLYELEGGISNVSKPEYLVK